MMTDATLTTSRHSARRCPNRRLRSLLSAAAAFLVCGFLCAGNLHAFIVIKNVNSGKPPVAKFVIFEKGKTTSHLTFKDNNASSKMSVTKDGALEVKMTGFGEVTSTLSWKPGEKLKETFYPRRYTYVLLTCKMVGRIERVGPNGRTNVPLPANIYLSFRMYDKKGVRSGVAGIASMAEDGRTPKDMVTLKIPMDLLTKSAFNDIGHIRSVGFHLPKTGANMDRQLRLIVEKIALAD